MMTDSSWYGHELLIYNRWCLVPGAHKGRSVQLGGTAFESEQLEHLPYMDLSSSGA